MARKTPPEFEIKIDQLVFGGEGIGYFDKRPVFVYGVLPGETVLVRPIKVNSKFVKAAVVKILEPSPDRVESQESHYLTCSPWQVMPYKQQLEEKKKVVKSMWQKFAHSLPQDDVSVIPSPVEWKYRNKLEFSVVDNEGEVSLAFHQRFRHSRYYNLDSCVLGSDDMNRVAKYILDTAVKNNYDAYAIKNVLVRYSFSTQSTIATLYTTNRDSKIFTAKSDRLSGFSIVYSDPKSPAAVTSSVLSVQGNFQLQENISGINLLYGANSFFQVNPDAFTLLLDDVKKELANKTGVLLDLYAGVGTIGFALSNVFDKVYSVESNEEASDFAQKNVKMNKLDNIVIENGMAERQNLAELLSCADVVVVDPPRAGLHPKVVEKLRDYGPETLVYISCNPATQARDWEILKQVYNTSFWQLYDLYPQTPHVESVLILER